MDALILTLVVSLALCAAAVGLLIWTVFQGTHEHHDRLALFPLEHDAPPPKHPSPTTTTDH